MAATIGGAGEAPPQSRDGAGRGENAELARRLTDMDLPETEASVQVKINRGTFPAWFMLAALRAIGVQSLRLE